MVFDHLQSYQSRLNAGVVVQQCICNNGEVLLCCRFLMLIGALLGILCLSYLWCAVVNFVVSDQVHLDHCSNQILKTKFHQQGSFGIEAYQLLELMPLLLRIVKVLS